MQGKKTGPWIGVIVSDQRVQTQVEAVREQITTPLDVRFADVDTCVNTANEAVASGALALVSRGSLAHTIRSSGIGVPVIEIALTGFDILELLDQARTHSSCIAVVAFDNMIEGALTIASKLGLELRTCRITGPEDAVRGVQQMYDAGLRVLIGGGRAVSFAEALGMKAFLIRSRTEGVLRALREADHMIQAVLRERVTSARRDVMLDSIPEAIISLDATGHIIHYNRLATTFFAHPKNLAGQLPSLTASAGAEHPLDKEARSAPNGVDNFLEGIGLFAAVRDARRWSGEIRHYGAIDYACTLNPVYTDGVYCGGVAVIQEVAHLQKLEQKVRKTLYNKGHVARYCLADVIHRSPATKLLIETARDYAKSPSTILIQGESGTGKEIFAQSIHRESRYHEGPFVGINCTALPENLLESELFGYGEGAFTGARKGGKPGLFEMAHRGTLFLDEIGEIPTSVQARLLRVLEEKSVMRLGQETNIPIDVRIICATNRDLERLMHEGQFREDLYYRLNVLRLELLPLRERPEDIELLMEHFLKVLPESLGMPCPVVSPEARQLLTTYRYPGNIRELRNIVERLVVVARGGVVHREDAAATLRRTESRADRYATDTLPAPLPQPGGADRTNKTGTVFDTAAVSVPNRGLIREEEAALIRRVLAETNGNKAESARRLGISPSTLWRRLHQNKVKALP